MLKKVLLAVVCCLYGQILESNSAQRIAKSIKVVAPYSLVSNQAIKATPFAARIFKHTTNQPHTHPSVIDTLLNGQHSVQPVIKIDPPKNAITPLNIAAIHKKPLTQTSVIPEKITPPLHVKDLAQQYKILISPEKLVEHKATIATHNSTAKTINPEHKQKIADLKKQTKAIEHKNIAIKKHKKINKH